MQEKLSLYDALAVVLAELMAMSDGELLLFKQVYNGANYPQAAQALGYTKVNACAKFSRLARVSRLFAEFERYKGRGHKGARHNPPLRMAADVMRQLKRERKAAKTGGENAPRVYMGCYA